MPEAIDFPSYLTAPRLSAASAVVLVRRLINAAPDDLSEKEKAALERARTGAITIQSVAKARDRARPENLTAEDRRFDGYWGALREQLAAWTRVQGEAEQVAAQDLLTSLFPDGLTFVTTSYDEEWFESAKRLARIDEEGLEEAISGLVHAGLLPKLRAAHVALGEGLGVGETHVTPPSSDALRLALRSLGGHIADYARILSGGVDVDDADSAARFLTAMSPLDRHRAAYPSGGKPSGGGASPVTPTPEPQPIVDPGEPGPDAPLPPVP